MKRIFTASLFSIVFFHLSACSHVDTLERSSLPVATSSESSDLESVGALPKVYTDEKFQFSFQYPADREVLDQGIAGLAASLNLVLVKKHAAIDSADAFTVRIYEKPNWSENDGWIGEDDDVAKIITQGNYLAQIYNMNGSHGDMAAMNMLKSTFRFKK